MLNDRSVLANGYLLTDPQHPSLKLPAAPAQFDVSLPSIHRGAPTIGEHSQEVLLELGYSKERIKKLVEAGTVGPIRNAPDLEG